MTSHSRGYYSSKPALSFPDIFLLQSNGSHAMHMDKMLIPSVSTGNVILADYYHHERRVFEEMDRRLNQNIKTEHYDRKTINGLHLLSPPIPEEATLALSLTCLEHGKFGSI